MTATIFRAHAHLPRQITVLFGDRVSMEAHHDGQRRESHYCGGSDRHDEQENWKEKCAKTTRVHIIGAAQVPIEDKAKIVRAAKEDDN